MRLFDCFTFFNELDLLELRLSELHEVVDRFVITESPLTFTGKEKPLHFEQNRERFARFANKIDYVVVDDMPTGPGVTAWDREFHQRRALTRGYRDAAPDDLVMISDLDEIARPEVLARLKADPLTPKRFTVLESEASFFFINCCPVGGWPSLVQAPRLLAARHARDPQKIRAFRPILSRSKWAAPLQPGIARLRAWVDLGAALEVSIARNASWHFTYLGGIEAVRTKIASYAHTELATAETLDRDRIAKAMADRSFIIGNFKLEDVPLDARFPRTITQNPAKWAHLLAPQEAASGA